MSKLVYTQHDKIATKSWNFQELWTWRWRLQSDSLDRGADARGQKWIQNTPKIKLHHLQILFCKTKKDMQNISVVLQKWTYFGIAIYLLLSECEPKLNSCVTHYITKSHKYFIESSEFDRKFSIESIHGEYLFCCAEQSCCTLY